ncbi:hypothetical protein CC79DRAFT_1323849 [Sarocladium strictum]
MMHRSIIVIVDQWLEIADALYNNCGIPGELYFVAVRGPDGDVTTFFSPGRLSHDDAESSFFDIEKFKQVSRQPDPNGQTIPPPSFDTALSFYGRVPHDSQSRSAERRRLPPAGGDDWDNTSASARKRQRARHYSQEDNQQDTMSVMTRKGLKIGDAEAVYNYYEQAFKSCQQSACKLIAKAWVKVLAPKKQSTHPYTGSDERAPDWWPKPWGTSKEERVRHKEPDHLYKRERIALLIHILRLAVEPPKNQLADLQKLNVNVKKLEDATWEALSGWLAESEANASKKPFISRIFRVAKMEERYKDDMLDASASVYVPTDEGNSSDYGSENEDMRGGPDDDEIASPSRSHRAPMLMGEERSPIAPNNASLVGNLPMRTASFAAQQGQMPNYMPAHQPHNFDDGSLPAHSQPPVNPTLPVDMAHASSGHRRGSLFHDFNANVNPGGPSTAFPNQWQPVPHAVDPSHGYPFQNHQQAHAGPQAYANPGIPLQPADHPGYLPTAFDGVPRGAYEANPMFRQSDLPAPTGNQPQSYPYTSPDGSHIRGPGQGMDPEPRHDL